MKINGLRAVIWSAIILPCAFCGWMTVRSPGHREILTWSSPRRVSAAEVSAGGIYAISDDGLLSIGFESVTWFGPGSGSSSRTFLTATSPAGFSFESRTHASWRSNESFWATNYVDWQPAYRNHARMVRLPWWSVWIASLAVAGIYYIWWRRARLLEMRVRNGLCIRCGYDLRESPGRCPECGRDPGKN